MPQFSDEMITRIKSVIDPSEIDVIISNHGEPDHSGSTTYCKNLHRSQGIFISAPNGGNLMHNYGELLIVPAKQVISLSVGRRTLQFIQAANGSLAITCNLYSCLR